ncbi:MAG TPA: ABC-2 family transporter protein [Bacteriovoracaceae bacterium]|nr:ABC-2 family transporter protein [Bacteriovoracaceae bacterium]
MRGFSSIVAMELRKIFAYRTDFWVTFLGQTLIQLLIARSLWQNIFETNNVTSMQGFNLEMMTLYYLLVPIGVRILAGQNIGFLSQEIYDGTFTRYLIYPVNAFVYKSITYLTHSFFYCIQLFFIYLIFHLFFTDMPLNPQGLFIGLFVFFIASVCYMSMSMIVELISLWADYIWALMVMLRFFVTFFGGGIIPMDFFPDWAISILKYTPFPYLISLPVKSTMSLIPLSETIEGLSILTFWSFIFFGIVNLMWRRGQKSYAGVGI